MFYSDLTRKAMRIAYEAHSGQFDKSGVPYIYHPMDVAEHVETEYETCVALLHDVVEDTDVTISDLRQEGFPEEVLEALALMTHDPEVPYMEYVRTLRDNPIARVVKLSDLRHNSMESRLTVVDDKARARLKKYAAARKLLLDCIED